MMNHPFDMDRFLRVPIVGIWRGFAAPVFPGLIDAVIGGGLTTIEITMNTPNAPSLIRQAVEIAGNQLNIGAGTVINEKLLDQAIEAGASFIVTPTVVPRVIAKSRSRGIPVFAGAFSPSEIEEAWSFGATMVKIFPAEILGPGFIRGIKAPMPCLKLMPTGGVDLETLEAYRAAGADAFGIGSPIFKPDRVAAQDWEWIRLRCAAFVDRWQLLR